MESYVSLAAVEAVLRGDEAPPPRVDSISVGMSNACQPPPPPSSRPPRLPPHHPSHANGEHSSPLSRPKGHPSHGHRELPPPPISRSKDGGSPLPPLPGSPKQREKEPLPPERLSSSTDKARLADSEQGPPLPSRSSLHGGRRQNRPPLPQRHGSSPMSSGPAGDRGGHGRVSPPSSSGPGGPFVPPRTTRSPPNMPPRHPSPSFPVARTPSEESPRKPIKPDKPVKPPPAGNRPRPTVPKKPALLSPTAGQARPLSKRAEVAPPTRDIGELIRSLLTEAPEIIKAVQDDYGTVPQLLEDLANLGERIAEAAREETVKAPSVSFSRCLTMLKGEVSALRDLVNSDDRPQDRVTKVINNIVKQVRKISDLLQAR